MVWPAVAPSTEMVSLTEKPDVRPLTAPDSTVEPVIAPAGPTWTAGVPVTVLSPMGVAGVVVGKGLLLKSYGLRPPRALIVPAAAVELTAVVGVDGRLAA